MPIGEVKEKCDSCYLTVSLNVFVSNANNYTLYLI